MPRQAEPWKRKGRPGWWAWVKGKQVKLLDGGTKAEAWDALHKLLATHEPGPPPRSDLTLYEACQRFLLHSQAVHGPANHEAHRWRLKTASDILGPLRLADLTKSHIERLIASYDAAPDSRRGVVASLRRMLQWCRDQKPPLFGPDDPTKGVRLPPAGRRDRILTAEERQRLLAAARPEFRDLLEVLGQLGVRPHIAYALEAKDIDWGQKIATRPSKRRTYTIHLTNRAIAILRPLAEKYPDGPLLRNADGEPWTRNAVRCRFARLCKRLGITDRVTAYSFRHTFATDALAKGVDAATVGELMNHKDLNMLARHYSHLAQRRAEMLQAAERIAGPEPPARTSLPESGAADTPPEPPA